MRQMEESELVKQPEDATECPYKADASIKEAAQAKAWYILYVYNYIYFAIYKPMGN